MELAKQRWARHLGHFAGDWVGPAEHDVEMAVQLRRLRDVPAKKDCLQNRVYFPLPAARVGKRYLSVSDSIALELAVEPRQLVNKVRLARQRLGRGNNLVHEHALVVVAERVLDLLRVLDFVAQAEELPLPDVVEPLLVRRVNGPVPDHVLFHLGVLRGEVCLHLCLGIGVRAVPYEVLPVEPAAPALPLRGLDFFGRLNALAFLREEHVALQPVVVPVAVGRRALFLEGVDCLGDAVTVELDSHAERVVSSLREVGELHAVQWVPQVVAPALHRDLAVTDARLLVRGPAGVGIRGYFYCQGLALELFGRSRELVRAALEEPVPALGLLDAVDVAVEPHKRLCLWRGVCGQRAQEPEALEQRLGVLAEPRVPEQ